MIRESIKRFLARISDTPIIGRNGARIVLGTDRKDVIGSGYGDGGANDVGAAAVEIVAGYEDENVNFDKDKSKLYLSAKSNPDEYLNINSGEANTSTPSAVLKSDQVYLVARKNIKIVNGGVSILIKEDGSLEVESDTEIKFKCGAGTVNIQPSGEINIGSEDGPGERIITENAVCVGTDPVTGAPIVSSFLHPLAIIPNLNKKIKL